MSDGVIIPLDVDDAKAKAKFYKLKKQAGDVGKALNAAQVGSVAARMGGGGGAIGRALGGFSIGAGMGFAGAGLAASGMLLSRAMNVEAGNTARAQAGVKRVHDSEDMMRRISDKRATLEAGGLSFAGKIARATYRKESVTGVGQRGADFGLTPDQMLDVNAAAMPGASSTDVAKGLATGMIGNSADEVAKNIKKSGGLFRALAVATKVSPKQAESDYASFMSNPVTKNAMAANVASGLSQQTQINALATGKTTAAVMASESDKMNPEKREREEAYRAARRVADLLDAAAKEQSKYSDIMKSLAGDTPASVEALRAEAEARRLSSFAPGSPTN